MRAVSEVSNAARGIRDKEVHSQNVLDGLVFYKNLLPAREN